MGTSTPDNAEQLDPTEQFPAPARERPLHMFGRIAGGPLPLYLEHPRGLYRAIRVRRWARDRLKQSCPTTWRMRIFLAQRDAVTARETRLQKRGPEGWKAYYFQKSGDVARQLAFGGIAVAWVLGGGPQATRLPADLMPAILTFSLALGADLLQYVFGAFVHDVRARVGKRFTYLGRAKNAFILVTY